MPAGWRRLDSDTYECSYPVGDADTCSADAPYVSPSFGDAERGASGWDGQARCERHILPEPIEQVGYDVAGALLEPPAEGELPQVIVVGDVEWLACYGHVDMRLFVCLAVAGLAAHHFAAAEALLADRSPNAVMFDARHGWAVEAGDGDDRVIYWADVDELTPGAVPFTFVAVK